MARKEYISDHLVNMREHLKRNYEKFHQNASAAHPGDVAEKEDVPAENPVSWDEPSADIPPAEKKIEEPVEKSSGTPVNLRYMPSIRKGSANDASVRARRELEGKVIRDLNMSETKIQLLEQKLAETKQFHQVLKSTHEELLKIAESEDSSALNMLQAKYYAASGRWQAFESSENQSAVSSGSVQNGGIGTREIWILAGAILAGCAILSLVLMGIF